MKNNKAVQLLCILPVTATIITFGISTFFFGMLLTGTNHIPKVLMPVFYNMFDITLITALANLILLLTVLFLLFQHKEHQKKILWHLGLMFINVPLTIIYLTIILN